MNKNRPVNLDLMTLKFPLPSIVSIMHRISGAFLFLLLPFALYLLGQSLHSKEALQAIQASMGHFYIKILVWAFLSALWYHLIAGIRHLTMDLGLGESLPVARLTAKLVFVFAAILILLTGWWLW